MLGRLFALKSCPWPAQLRGNFQAFLTGGVAALAFGYYQLHQDVWRAADAVESRLEVVGRESVSTHAALQTRVNALEDGIKRLKATPEPVSKGQ